MTNEDMLDDLKQFIDARFAQQDADLDRKLDEKLETELEEKLAPIHKQISDLSDYVSDAIDTANEVNGKQLANHETRLEQSAA